MKFILSLREQGLGYRRLRQVLNEKRGIKLTRGPDGVKIMFMQYLKGIRKD